MGLLSALGGLFQSDDDRASGTLNGLQRFGDALHNSNSDIQAAQMQNEATRGALQALADNRDNGITNPQQNLNALGQYDPKYTQAAAQIQAQNPLAELLTPSGNGTQGNGGQGAGQPGGGQSLANLSGDDLLKALPPQVSSVVKGLNAGKINLNANALKAPYWQQMMQLTEQAFPDQFDMADYPKRVQAAKSFAPGGKDNTNIKSIETAINTLSQLQGASDKLGGVNNASVLTKPANWLENEVKSASSNPDLNTYNQFAKTAADEVSKAVVGGTGGTGGDRDKREQIFTANQSPDARAAAIKGAISELESRLDPINSSYNEGFKKNSAGVQLLSPKAQAAYQKLMGVAPDNASTNDMANQSGSSDNATGAQDPVAKAKAAGYSDAEIKAYLAKKGKK